MALTARSFTATLNRVPVWMVYFAGAIPAVVYFYLGVMDQLGADPLKVLEKALGLWALRFLIVSLAITPLREILKINLLGFRRALGLMCFFYVTLHLITYLVLDQGLDGSVIWADILKRPYITIGMASFLLLVPLALTSNNASIRKLGTETWRKLHRLVYVAAIGGAVHFVLLVKSWPLEPLVYAAIVAALLSWRLLRRSEKKAGRPARA